MPTSYWNRSEIREWTLQWFGAQIFRDNTDITRWPIWSKLQIQSSITLLLKALSYGWQSFWCSQHLIGGYTMHDTLLKGRRIAHCTVSGVVLFLNVQKGPKIAHKLKQASNTRNWRSMIYTNNLVNIDREICVRRKFIQLAIQKRIVNTLIQTLTPFQ